MRYFRVEMSPFTRMSPNKYDSWLTNYTVSNIVIEHFEVRNLLYNKRTLIAKFDVTKNDLV